MLMDEVVVLDLIGNLTEKFGRANYAQENVCFFFFLEVGTFTFFLIAANMCINFYF